MQKLLRRSTPGPLLSLATNTLIPPTAKKNNSLSLGFSSNNLSLPLGFKRHTNKTQNHNHPVLMPAASAFRLRPPPPVAGSVPVKQRVNPGSTVPFRVYSTTWRRWGCSLSNCGRAWVVVKEGRTGSRSAWCHTAASNGGGLERANDLGVAEDSGNGEKGLFNSVEGVDNGEEGGSLAAVTEVEKPLRVNRRQKGALSSVAGEAGPPGNADLLTIPGVGPRNLRKLVEKGIEEVAQLKQLYKAKFFGKSSQKMVEYLQSSVGIIHKNHAESITTFIRKSVDEELEDSSDSGVKPVPKKRFTFCVEGNISVGKTTFLQRIANETLELQDLVEVVPEPINKWQDVGPDHFNILDAFYAEPQRYAYTFQNYVFVTRVMQERETSGGVKPLRLMERSVFSDRMVFVRAVHEANWMNEMEISIYDSWFDPVVSSLPGLIPDGFIYLRASPDTCHQRMMLRKRAEEGGVSLDYLRDLHEKHESWLFPSQSGNHGILSVCEPPIHLGSSLHPDIRDRVFYLEGEHMHSSIQKVPALVLDCEPNIDFSRDIEAKQQYARQVAEFFAFVKKANGVLPSRADAATKRNLPNVLMPRNGLWVPEGIPQAALKSMDFRRAMSSYMSS